MVGYLRKRIEKDKILTLKIFPKRFYSIDFNKGTFYAFKDK